MNEKLYYRDFDRMGRSLIRTLRRNHNAVVVYPSSYNLDNVLLYLKQHGYPANPRLDNNAQYFMDKDISSINSSNILMSRIMKQPQNWI